MVLTFRHSLLSAKVPDFCRLAIQNGDCEESMIDVDKTSVGQRVLISNSEGREYLYGKGGYINSEIECRSLGSFFYVVDDDTEYLIGLEHLELLN